MSLRFFLCIFIYLRSHELEFCSLILIKINIFLDTDIFGYNLELFIYFVSLFIHLLVNTCIITHILLQFVLLTICNIWLLLALLFLSLHVDHIVTNASLFLCLFLNMYMQILIFEKMLIFLSFTFTIITIQYLCNICKNNVLLSTSFALLFIYFYFHRCKFVYWYTLLL